MSESVTSVIQMAKHNGYGSALLDVIKYIESNGTLGLLTELRRLNTANLGAAMKILAKTGDAS